MAVETTIQFRRGAAATWTNVNPTLAAGEPGFESDTNKFKIGDGVTAWTALDYATDGSDLTTGGTITGNLVITGTLQVDGSTTTVNSTTLTVDDKNIELGSTASPTDATADGGGITLKGTTDKTFIWVDSTDSWTSSEHLALASGKVYKINGTEVLSSSALGSGVTSSSLTSVGTITTGTWNGTTIAVANGGTGATTAADARANLDLEIGVDVQAYDAELAALAGLTSAADKMPYFTGSGTASVADFTSFGRSLVDDVDASAARTTLGVAIGTDVQAYDAELAALAGLTSAADKLPYFTGSGTASVADFTTFGRSLVDDVDASAARTTLGLVIGTNVQAYDATLAAVAGGTYTGDDSITTVGTIGTGTWQGTVVGVAYGGTGLSSYAAGDLVYASGATTLSKLAKGTAKQFLKMNSAGTAPEWSSSLDGGTP